MHCDQIGRRPLGRAKFRDGVGSAAQGSTQPGGTELRRGEVAAQVIALRLVHGRIKFDEYFAGVDALSIADMDRSHDPGLERLDHFGAPARDDFSRRRGDDIDFA